MGRLTDVPLWNFSQSFDPRPELQRRAAFKKEPDITLKFK